MDTPNELVDYMVSRDRQRHEQVIKTLEALTETQRALMKEMAVMGYVLGRQANRVPVPQDWIILWNVIAACLELPDLYPVVNDLHNTQDGDDHVDA